MSNQSSQKIDYLVIGHVSRDVARETAENGYTPGGTVTFSGRMAQALGCHTAVLTSTAADYDLAEILPDIEIEVIPAAQNTIFDNIYQANHRVQILHSVAETITAAAVPDAWREAAIVHLGPIANEVDPAIIDLFPHSLIGLTPQGWMRRWKEDGRVYAKRFREAQTLFQKATAVIISEEDLLDPAMLTEYKSWAHILVMTENYAGCTVFVDGEAQQVPAPKIELVEPTGAGDIFATAFFIQLKRNGGDPIEAAAFANFVAAHSVTQTNLAAKVTAWQKAHSHF